MPGANIGSTDILSASPPLRVADIMLGATLDCANIPLTPGSAFRAAYWVTLKIPEVATRSMDSQSIAA
jgi:hypothetical protein